MMTNRRVGVGRRVWPRVLVEEKGGAIGEKELIQSTKPFRRMNEGLQT